MPTVFRFKGFRFFFFSNERNEPPHVHVEFGDGLLKMWLNSVEVASSMGFSPKDIKAATDVIKTRQKEFLEKWHEHFSR